MTRLGDGAIHAAVREAVSQLEAARPGPWPNTLETYAELATAVRAHLPGHSVEVAWHFEPPDGGAVVCDVRRPGEHEPVRVLL